MEQKQNGKLNNYFKIIGIIVLLSHTFFMGMEILYGLLSVFVVFLKGILSTFFHLLKLQYLVLVAIWIIILKYLKNSDLLSIQKMLFQKKNGQNKINCQVCNRPRCNKIYAPCLHAFHQDCLNKKQQDPDRRISCPSCSEGNGSKTNYFLKRLQQLYNQYTFIAKVILYTSIASGVYGFYYSF